MPNERGRSAGRRPDYEIKALNKETQARMRVGAAWLKDDGSGHIYIKLEPFVVLRGEVDMAITAYPTEEEGPYELPGREVSERSRRTTREAEEFPDEPEDPLVRRPRSRRGATAAVRRRSTTRG